MSSPTRGRRADAERNREAIVEAGIRVLTDSPRASMADIAMAAGVTRVTMYGHFSSRPELVRAIFTRAMSDADKLLSDVDLTGPAIDALERLVLASWRVVRPARVLLDVARDELGAEELHARHESSQDRLLRLVRRGRAAGEFRTDLPAAWLVACYQNVLHGAADEVRSGRLTERAADRVVWPTIRSLFAPGPDA